MRIAIWHNLPTGGGLRVLDAHIRGLVERGHEVHLWAPPSAAGVEASSLLASAHELPLVVPAAPGRRDELTAAWRGRRPDLDAFAEHSARCAAEIDALGPDVVLAHSCQFYRVPAIGAFVSAPAVLYLHEPNRALYEASFGFPWAEEPTPRSGLRPASVRSFVHDLVRVEGARIQVRAETAWVHAFDEVLVNSLFNREAVLRAYGRSSRVASPGVDAGRFAMQTRPAASRGSIVTVGALVAEKDPHFLIRAAAAAGPAIRRFVWVANYAGGLRSEVTASAAEAGVPLELRVGVSEAELLRAYAEADVFVYAPHLEPLGLAPLEASATGLPIVAVAEGGVRETVRHGVNGLFVDHDAAQFGAAVAELLEDPARAQALGRAGRDLVESDWSESAALDRFVALLGDAVRQTSAASRHSSRRSTGTSRLALP